MNAPIHAPLWWQGDTGIILTHGRMIACPEERADNGAIIQGNHQWSRDAPLIVAAPELLETLKYIFSIADVEYVTAEARALQRQQIQLAARNAIAHATGQQPEE